MNAKVDQQQIAKLNLRASPELMERIDRCRAEMLGDPRYGGIPSRSEFVRLAIESFLDGWGVNGEGNEGSADR